MWNAVIAVGIVFSVTVLIIPPIGALAWWIGAVDVPKDNRRMHARPIPRCGGIAILIAILIGITMFCESSPLLLRMTIGASLLALVGLLDDILSISAFLKLAVQVLASVLACGFSFRVDALFAIFWITLLTNAHNFIDGIDGLFAGCAVVEGIVLAIILFWIGEGNLGLTALLIAISCFAFRAYNRHPACIFAGDCGSATVGYLLGVLSLPLFYEMKWEAGWLSPIFLFAYPITDLGIAVIRRVLRGQSPFAADRAHLHHRICAIGVGQVACGNILILLCAIFGVLGVSLCTGDFLFAASLICLIAAVILVELRLFLCRI